MREESEGKGERRDREREVRERKRECERERERERERVFLDTFHVFINFYVSNGYTNTTDSPPPKEDIKDSQKG